MSSRKLKRWESKKRKIETFLGLASSNDRDRAKKRVRFADEHIQGDEKTETTNNDENEQGLGSDQVDTAVDKIQDRLRALRELSFKRRLKAEYPLFYLTPSGENARISLRGDESSQESLPLIFEDIKALILASFLGIRSPARTHWCRLHRCQRISHVLLLFLKGLSADDLKCHVSRFPFVSQEFRDVVQIFSPAGYGLSVPQELAYIHISRNYLQKVQGRKSSGQNRDDRNRRSEGIFQIAKIKSTGSSENPSDSKRFNLDFGDNDFKSNESRCTKMDLLLSPQQLLDEGYPIPFGNTKHNDCTGYIYTKDAYKNVTHNSPVYALDCEMCLTTAMRNELTRVSIINEEFEVVYDTLVKPYNKIVNYLTKFSGITKKMLDPVTTRISDVQKVIRDVLPADAILCGQSLNFDLHSLKMVHPYVIDTSVIFNLSGIRKRKSGLKSLTHYFLDEKIQASSDGHCSVEDSRACMKLLKLKLQNPIEFGDVASGFTPWLDDTQPRAADNATTHKSDFVKSLFSEILANKKSVCVVGTQESLAEYPAQTVPKDVHVVYAHKDKKVLEHTASHAMEYGFMVSHVDVRNLGKADTPPEKRFSKIDRAIRSIYGACAEKCLMVVVGLDDAADVAAVKDGVCMVKIKADQQRK